MHTWDTFKAQTQNSCAVTPKYIFQPEQIMLQIQYQDAGGVQNPGKTRLEEVSEHILNINYIYHSYLSLKESTICNTA